MATNFYYSYLTAVPSPCANCRAVIQRIVDPLKKFLLGDAMFAATLTRFKDDVDVLRYARTRNYAGDEGGHLFQWEAPAWPIGNPHMRYVRVPAREYYSS